MQYFYTNDTVVIRYRDIGSKDAQPMVLIHGWTGSSAVFQRNIPVLSQQYRVIALDLRGHGSSDKGVHGHVSRLAMDLKELIDHLKLPSGNIIGIGASLGCAVLWSFTELFTPSVFSHMVFIDQAPLQNYADDGSWGADCGSRGCNSASSLAYLRATLRFDPREVYQDTVESCLAYRSHPLPTDNVTQEQQVEDQKFFIDIAIKGDYNFYGDLMADHTALDWRDSIKTTFMSPNYEDCKILVIASSRSGCFPAKGPLTVVDIVNSAREYMLSEREEVLSERTAAKGITISWGGHWCYWENPMAFNSLILDFLGQNNLDDYGQTYYGHPKFSSLF